MSLKCNPTAVKFSSVSSAHLNPIVTFSRLHNVSSHFWMEITAKLRNLPCQWLEVTRPWQAQKERHSSVPWKRICTLISLTKILTPQLLWTSAWVVTLLHLAHNPSSQWWSWVKASYNSALAALGNQFSQPLWFITTVTLPFCSNLCKILLETLELTQETVKFLESLLLSSVLNLALNLQELSATTTNSCSTTQLPTSSLFNSQVLAMALLCPSPSILFSTHPLMSAFHPSKNSLLRMTLEFQSSMNGEYQKNTEMRWSFSQLTQCFCPTKKQTLLALLPLLRKSSTTSTFQFMLATNLTKQRTSLGSTTPAQEWA